MKKLIQEASAALYIVPLLLALAACNGANGCGPQSGANTTCGAGTIGQRQSDGSCVCVPNQSGLGSSCP